MSRESILKIKETEQQAAKRRSDAKARAEERIARAEADGKAMCDKTEADAKAEYAAVLSEIREKCDLLAQKNQAETEEEITRLRREVSLRRKIAEKIILRGLESKCR